MNSHKIVLLLFLVAKIIKIIYRSFIQIAGRPSKLRVRLRSNFQPIEPQRDYVKIRRYIQMKITALIITSKVIFLDNNNLPASINNNYHFSFIIM